MEELYFDNAATTKAYAEVADLVSKLMVAGFGNPSSLHRYGINASLTVKNAAKQIALFAGDSNWQVIFTSGGTEANNLAISGSVPKGKRDTAVISSLEHSSVTQAAEHLKYTGGQFIQIKAQKGATVSPLDIAAAVDKKTAIVSVCHVAGEMGTVQPVDKIAKAVKRKNPKTRVHVDAVQAAPELSKLDYPAEVDMITLSGHKFNGPMGVGVLLVRKGIFIKPFIFGGDQQNGIRPGTLNMPAIAGMGLAAEITAENREVRSLQLKENTAFFRDLICNNDGVRVLGDQAFRAPGIIVAAIRGVRSEVFLHTMESLGLFASAGSACHSSRTLPPACYVDEGLKQNEGVIRFSPGADYSKDNMKQAAAIFKDALFKVRSNTAAR